MQLKEMEEAVRIELQDTDKAIWEEDDITRAIQKTISLLSRFIPSVAVVEATITREITGETLTIASDTGTLAYKPVKVGSLSIPNKTLDTHYTINYATGVVTEISSGLPDADYTVAYDLDPIMLDIDTLLPRKSYIKIEKIEYPVGDDPPTYITFDVFGEFLLVKGKGIELTEDRHLRIIYHKPWTAPTDSADGDYPEHLDDPVIIGSVGQALIFKAEKYTQQAVLELALVNAAADSMATPLADINIALDKVDTHAGEAGAALDKVAEYLETSGTTDNAKDVLANITDEATELRNEIKDALLLRDRYLTDTSVPPSAHDYLIDGDDLIDASNAGQNVAENYADYARVTIEIFNALVREANTRLSNLRSYIEEAQAWMRMGDTFVAEAGQRLGQANAFIGEAVQRIAEVNAWAVQADRYATTSREYLNIAGRYLASGQSKINEFLVSLGIKPEYRVAKSSSEQFS